MKKLLLLLMISLLGLASCETYCERNFPSEIIAVDPLPAPALSDVGYPDGPEELLAILERTRLEPSDPIYLSDQRAVAAILADYAEPLRVLIELHIDRFQDLLTQVQDE